MTKKKGTLRTGIQVAVFLLVAAIAIDKTLIETGVWAGFFAGASLHAVCPFGGVVSIYQFFVDGTFVKKIHESSFILMAIVFTLAVAFGPVFCGWICPMGSIQEWVGKLGRRLFKKRYNHFVPQTLDRVLRYLRYGVLAWVLTMTAFTGKLIFEEVDPFMALFSLWSSELSLTGLGILVLVLLLSLFVERPFCKYACPYGAVLGLTNLFRVFGIRRQPATCTSCRACDRTCPMNINVSGKTLIRDHQCISCLKCTSEQACPIPQTVALADVSFRKVVQK